MEIILSSSYILVTSRGYILLISSCPMNQIKVGKLAIIASNTCNFISKLLQGTKIMVVSCSTVQKFH